MPFLDDVLAEITKAQEEVRQEERERQKFENDWLNLRGTVVQSLFTDAANALARSGIGGDRSFHNHSAVLKAKQDRSGWQHSLTLSADKKRCVIIFRTSIKDEPETTYTLDELTEDFLGTLIKRFVYAAVRGEAKPSGGVVAMNL